MDISLEHTPPVQCNFMHEADSTFMITTVTFWKDSNIAGHILWEISGTCIDTKPQSIEVTCIVSGDEDDLHKFMNMNLETANKASGSVCTHLQKQSMTQAM